MNITEKNKKNKIIDSMLEQNEEDRQYILSKCKSYEVDNINNYYDMMRFEIIQDMTI